MSRVIDTSNSAIKTATDRAGVARFPERNLPTTNALARIALVFTGLCQEHSADRFSTILDKSLGACMRGCEKLFEQLGLR
jgi:hypothetical protein